MSSTIDSKLALTAAASSQGSSGTLDWLRVQCTDSSTTKSWNLDPSVLDYICLEGTAYDMATLTKSSRETFRSLSSNDSPPMKVSGWLILLMTFVSYVVH